MNWRLANSLKQLREQINAQYPNRDKSSDGSIGDAKHASRSSDHNPWVKDKRKQPVVTAIDIDEDLSASIHTLRGIVDAICASRDPRVKYIIYEGRITVKGTELQVWKKYIGTNSHSHHAHISVSSEEWLFDDEREWALDVTPLVAEPSPVNANYTLYTVQRGDTLIGIARRFATSPTAIQQLNGLTSTLIKVNQTLRVR